MALEWLGYIELIDKFSFREQTSIRIPKNIRERAFSLQIDCEIQSTDGNDYVNSKSLPAYGFYGYAVIVLKDYSTIQIPLNQPRQTLYYERRSDAYVNWYNLFLQRAFREYSRGLAEVIGQIGEAVGLGSFVVPPQPCIPWSGFEEVRAREVYVKTRFGTRFSLEISHIRPVTRTGDTDCDYDPISEQDDGDKDNGLPPNGVQPNVTNNPCSNYDEENLPDPEYPCSPYSNFPEPSNTEDLGSYFNFGREDSVDEENPDNAPSDPPPLIYWIKTVSRIRRPEYEGGCSTVRVETFYIELLNESIEYETRQNGTPIASGCGDRTSVQRQIRLTGGEWFLIGFDDSDSPMTFEKQSGFSLPPYSLTFE